MLSLKHRLLVLKNIYESKPIDLVLVSRKLLDLSIEKFHKIFVFTLVPPFCLSAEPDSYPAIMNNRVQEPDYLPVVMFNRR